MTEYSTNCQCTNCGYARNYDSENCPSCGSKQKTIILEIFEDSSHIAFDMQSTKVKEIVTPNLF